MRYSPQPNTNSQQVDVVVVGAGISGLCTAYRLAEQGCKVIVLEARDRVGGRTYGRLFKGEMHDLGGQWVGPHQKNILRIAAELGIKTFPQYHKGKKLLEINDKITAYSGTIPKLSILGRIDLQWAISRIERLCQQVPLAAPHQAQRAEEWDQMTVAAFQDEQMWTSDGRAVFTAAVRATFSAEPTDLSMLYFLWYLHSGGGLMKLARVKNGAQQDRFVGGAQQVSVRLAEEVENKGQRIILNAPVHAIRQEDDRVHIESAVGRFTAQRAIVAIPPPLAKTIHFQPPLPAERVHLHEQLAMGAVIKVIALYETPFWRQKGISGEILSHSNPLQLAFDDSDPHGAFGAIVGFLLGDTARQWTKRSSDELQAMVIGELVRYLGMDAANPVAFLQQDWMAERWSGGGYSAIAAPNVLMHGATALRHPCDRIHWAGSETAMNHVGYMDGAVEAGERAAKEVLQEL